MLAFVQAEPTTVTKYSQHFTECIHQGICSNIIDLGGRGQHSKLNTHLNSLQNSALNTCLMPTSLIPKDQNSLVLVMPLLSTLICAANTSLLSAAHLFISSPQLHSMRVYRLSEVLLIWVWCRRNAVLTHQKG